MYTIPLDPVFRNEKWVQSGNAVQLSVIKCVYYICRRNLLHKNYVDIIYPLTELPNNTFNKKKLEILAILQEVMPEIMKAKRVRLSVSDSGNAVIVTKATERRFKRLNGTLADVIPENAVPMMPQLAPDSRRQPNFIPTKPQPPAAKKPTDKPPSLTE